MVKVVETQIEGKLLEHQDLEPPQYSKIQIQEANKETTREENSPPYHEGEEMEIRELGLEGLEAACLDKILILIPWQQVTLLEKSII